MPVPKKKVTRTRRDKRRTHDSLRQPGLSTCSHCKELIKPHRVCPSCGYYNGKEVLVKEG